MIHFITDTTSGLTATEAKRIGVFCLPQLVIVGEKSYKDDSEIDARTFLEIQRTSTILPKTSAPPPVWYSEVYTEISAVGKEVIVLCPSSDVSGSMRSAIVAAQEYPQMDIRVVDTRTLGSGIMNILFKAIEWASQGLHIDRVVEKIKSMASRERNFFLVDTLEYMYKGGRIGRAKALMGRLLQIKPILSFRDGQVEPVELQRTHHRSFARLIELVTSQCPASNNSLLRIMHGEAKEKAIQLAYTISTMLNVPEIPIDDCPPAILVYAGPGLVGISFFVEDLNDTPV